MTRFAKLAAIAGLLLLTAAGPRPALLSRTAAGLWEVSGAPGAGAPARLCIADTALLAQFEHRGTRCTRSLIRDGESGAEIHYSCADGGFGRSTLSMLTPRSLRIETQGISGNEPFNYVLQARRVGDCAAH